MFIALGFFSVAVIGPPMVTVAHSNKSITVKLQAPRSPYKRKRGSTIPMTNYYDLLYQVFIINNLLDEVRVHSDKNPLSLKSQKIVGTCFTVETVFWDCESSDDCANV